MTEHELVQRVQTLLERLNFTDTVRFSTRNHPDVVCWQAPDAFSRLFLRPANGLEALEAALSKLAGEPPYLEVALRDAMDRVGDAETRITELEERLTQAHKTEQTLRAYRAPLRRIAELEEQLEYAREGGTPGRSAAYEERYQMQKRLDELEAKLERIGAITEDSTMDADEARVFVAGVLDDRIVK